MPGGDVDLEAKLRRWVEAGLLSPEQATRISEAEARDEEPAPAARGRVSLAGEALGYVGAAFVVGYSNRDAQPTSSASAQFNQCWDGKTVARGTRCSTDYDSKVLFWAFGIDKDLVNVLDPRIAKAAHDMFRKATADPAFLQMLERIGMDAFYMAGEEHAKWRREAAESFQRALSIDPNNVEAMISLGDLYKLEGLITRAQTCYEDALKISPENQQAKSRLQAIKKR